MKTAMRTQIDTALRDEWLRTVEDLASQIAQWVAAEPGWSFEQIDTQEVEEVPLGKYTVSIWSIRTPEGEVRLEPMARNYPGHGFLELYAWPTLRRVHLVPSESDRDWRVRVDAGFNLRQPWDREHFIILVQDLIGVEDLTSAA